MIQEIAHRLYSIFPVRSGLTILMYAISAILSGISILLIIPLLALNNENNSFEVSEEHIFINELIDKLGSSFEPSFSLFLTLLLLVLIAKSIFTIAAQYNSSHIKHGFETSYRKNLYKDILNSDILSLSNLNHGSVINILVNETRMIGMLFEYLMRIISYSLQLIVYIALIFLISSKLVMATLLFGLILYYLVSKVNRYARKSGEKIVSINSTVQSQVNSTFSGFKTIKAFSIERVLDKTISKSIEIYRKMNIRLVFIENLLIGSFEPIVMIFIISLYPFFSYDTSIFIAFILLLTRLYQSFQGMQGQFYKLSRHFPSLSAYDNLSTKLKIDKRKEDSSKEKIYIETEKTSLFLLKSVQFQYKDKEFCIGPIDLNINKGDFISIVGGSGSGKSTMAMLIMGLIHPDDGCIMFNGKNTFTDPPVKSSKKIGYVGQDVFMFNDSIKNNIIFGREFDLKKFSKAIEIAHLVDVIESLPEKENTFVGDSGAKLSGGQIQRVSIARALYDSPDFLIFDEATSSLDTNLSNSILEKIQQLKGKVTLLQVTHKIHETSGSDYVYVMENGKIVKNNIVK